MPYSASILRVKEDIMTAILLVKNNWKSILNFLPFKLKLRSNYWRKTDSTANHIFVRKNKSSLERINRLFIHELFKSCCIVFSLHNTLYSVTFGSHCFSRSSSLLAVDFFHFLILNTQQSAIRSLHFWALHQQTNHYAKNVIKCP